MKDRLKKVCRSRRSLSTLLLVLLTVTFAYAQTSIKGVVMDDNGMEVIGANVKQKGTTVGTITDLDGKFVLRVADANKAVLLVSFIGYDSQEVPLKGKTDIKITLSESSSQLDEVMVVAYGTQKKETLTGAISSLKTDALLRSPNGSVANTLAGQITGLSSVASSGKPGGDDPAIFVRGIGSINESSSKPLILVDGVERSFFQMDPNEIESVTVLKDASATAVFGVRGANGVVLVTTKRGVEGKAKISISSSVGVNQPTRILDMADSYTYAQCHNEMFENDGKKPAFDWYALERFRLGDEPIMYPNVDWRRYVMNNVAVQTQHNLNISGGTDKVNYFVSVGFLYQDGLYKRFKELSYDNSDSYNRYNYRANLDLKPTKTTTLKLSLGGIVGQSHDPNDTGTDGLFTRLNSLVPMSSPGVIDGYEVYLPEGRFNGVGLGGSTGSSGVSTYYNLGYYDKTSNTMTMDLVLNQNLDMITKGLSVEIKGAYNTTYTYKKGMVRTSVEKYMPFYQSNLEGLPSSPAVSDTPGEYLPDYNKTVVYQINTNWINPQLQFKEEKARGRDWYMEGSLRYNRKFGEHSVSGLFLYNQNKKYYPAMFEYIPTGYVGFVGRLTYDYKTRYMAEFNFGYNGSENYAPDKRYGSFPAGSIGYIITEEAFMKNQKVIDYLKIRASAGLVGNDMMQNNRYLYAPNGFNVNQVGTADSRWGSNPYGYNFGYDSSTWSYGATEKRIGNPDVTWEKAFKQNYGIDAYFLRSRLKVSADVFFEKRKDIMISRNTVPFMTSLTASILPGVNMAKVNNRGYEIEAKWNDRVKEFNYWINANVSFARNEIIEQDEIKQNELYMYRTGRPVGAIFGYVSEGFYAKGDFDENGKLLAGLPAPTGAPKAAPGDVKYKDLNGDKVINEDDQCEIGYPVRPEYTFGLNFGADYKGWFFTMNWVGATNRSLVLGGRFAIPFGNTGDKTGGLMQFHADNRWTEATAATAEFPRLSQENMGYNTMQSTVYVKDGSYAKLKTLTLGYNFTGNPTLKKIGISQLGLKFSGYNLLTLDKFGIMDPESKPNNDDTYPITKIFSLGVNINF